MSEKKSIKLFIVSAIGAGIGIVCASLIILLMAAVLSVGNIPVMMIPPLSFAAIIFGAFAGGFASARIFGESGIVCGLVSGTIFFLVLWASGGIFGLGDYTASVVIKAAASLAAAMLGGVIGVNSYKIK